MKTIKLVLVLALIALLPVIARGAPAPGAGIAGTAHDFYAGTFLTNTTIGECTFCHTPHKALQTALLWNHTLSSATFKWDDTTTTAGTTYPTIAGATYKGPTAKCLSCHDGSVAVGDVAWFDEKAQVVDATKITDATHQVGAGVGNNMAGNHPVAMPYPYNNLANKYNGSTTGSAATLTEWQATPVTPVKLYNDDGSGNISGGPAAGKSGIECSSCHDPHNKASTGDMFLRGTLNGNTTAYICLKCHIK